MNLEKYIESQSHPGVLASEKYAYKLYRGVADYLLEAGMSEESVVKLLRIQPIDVARIWKYAHELSPRTLGARWLIPTTEQQAFIILDGMLSKEEKAAFRSQSKDDFVATEHFGLGMWIRNMWIYGPDEEEDKAEEVLRDECFRMMAGMKKEDLCFEHPDTVSGRFLERYYEHLKETERHE